MNSRNIIVLLAILNAGLIGAYLVKPWFATSKSASQLKLEEILSIKELHLVKHSYNDLFFLHRKGNPEKPVRAIATIPVTITSYIDLKKIKLIKRNDSVVMVILPKAQLNDPNYEIDKMSVSSTRNFQLYAGRDLYASVTKYLQATLQTRMDSLRQAALDNHILEQAEAEGKEYVEHILRSVGRADIKVSFGEAVKDKQIEKFQKNVHFFQYAHTYAIVPSN